MSEAVRYCELCSRIISPGEISDGSAIVRGEMSICAACAERLPPERRAALTNSARVNNPPPRKHAASRKPGAPERPAAAAGKIMAYAALVFAAAFLAVLLFLNASRTEAPRVRLLQEKSESVRLQPQMTERAPQEEHQPRALFAPTGLGTGPRAVRYVPSEEARPAPKLEEPAHAESADAVYLTTTAPARNVQFSALGYSPQSGDFACEFTIRPNALSQKAYIGLSYHVVRNGWGAGAVMLVLDEEDVFLARDGDDIRADVTLRYEADADYRVRWEISFPNRRYSTFVKPDGGEWVSLGKDYAFRSSFSGKFFGPLGNWFLGRSQSSGDTAIATCSGFRIEPLSSSAAP